MARGTTPRRPSAGARGRPAVAVRRLAVGRGGLPQVGALLAVEPKPRVRGAACSGSCASRAPRGRGRSRCASPSTSPPKIGEPRPVAHPASAGITSRAAADGARVGATPGSWIRLRAVAMKPTISREGATGTSATALSRSADACSGASGRFRATAPSCAPLPTVRSSNDSRWCEERRRLVVVGVVVVVGSGGGGRPSRRGGGGGRYGVSGRSAQDVVVHRRDEQRPPRAPRGQPATPPPHAAAAGRGRRGFVVQIGSPAAAAALSAAASPAAARQRR